MRLGIKDNLLADLNLPQNVNPLETRSLRPSAGYSPEMSLLGLTKKDLDSLGKMGDTAKVWGPEGLLGQYLSMKFLNNPKFNVNFPESQINWNPNDRLSFYARPDSLEDDIPRGLQIGGSFKF